MKNRREDIHCPKCGSLDVSRMSQVKSENGNRMYKCSCGFIFEFDRKTNNNHGFVNKRLPKQKCGICQKSVIHSERNYLICLDDLIELLMLPRSEMIKKLKEVKKNG